MNKGWAIHLIPTVVAMTAAVMVYGPGALLLGAIGGLLAGQFLAMVIPFAHAGYIILRGSPSSDNK